MSTMIRCTQKGTEVTRSRTKYMMSMQRLENVGQGSGQFPVLYCTAARGDELRNGQATWPCVCTS